jgi:uroporphyrinogen-III decarboxylase
MDNQTLYQERADLIQRVINLEPVERIPVIMQAQAFCPRYMGMTMAEYCSNPDAPLSVTLAAMDRLGGLDGINLASAGLSTPLLSSVWLSRIAVPGRDLPADSLWQVQEAEVMTIADYDTIIEKGWQAFFMEYLPRVIDPAEFGAAVGWAMNNTASSMDAYRAHGYAPVCSAACTIPFEYFCGGRSMQKFFFDLYRIPDKVQAAMDRIFPDILGQAIGTAKASGVNGVWIGGWRSASALVGPKLWDRFVWPYILKFTYALIENGLTPVLHWDQDWSRDLIRLQELPAKKCILNPDGMTNLKKFKELAGDRMAMMGDIPAAIFSNGTPDDVYAYVRDLVELFDHKGLILAPGCDAPINTKAENMEAFIAASHAYDKVAD